VPGWLFYVVLWLALYLMHAVIKWYDGTLPFGTVNPLHLVFTGGTVYMLAVISYLNGIAEKALQKTRPALSVNDAEYARLHYELTVTPARPMLLANIVGVLGITAGWLFFFDLTFLQLAKIGLTPASKVVDITVTYANLIALSALIYHTIHQLRHVRRIYATYMEVDLFQISPLYAFSALTVRSAVAVIIPNYATLAALLVVSPALASNPLPVAVTVITFLTSIMIFVWPLLDLHNQMRVEKQQMLDENAGKMKTSFKETRRSLETGEFGDTSSLKDIVETLVAERTVLEKMPTWPWQATTVRGFSTALLLPILLWLMQRVLERLLNF
jgi:hypothetical protein